MRFKKIVPAHVEQRETHSRTVCDFCKTACWMADSDEIEIEAKIGNVWDDGDYRKVSSVDCCSACWKTKVRPAIEALGATFWDRDAEDYTYGAMPLDPEVSR